MYLVVGDIYSGTVHDDDDDDSVQAHGAEVIFCSGSQHGRVLPASGKPALWPSHRGRIDDLARIRVSVSGPELFDPARGDVHGLCNPGSGLPLLLLQYDPFYLGFIQLFHYTYYSTSSYMSPQLSIT